MCYKQKKLVIISCILILLLNAIISGAQNSFIDTIKIMTYNVGNFGKSPSTQCPLLNPELKSSYLRTILKFENPDIIGMTKIGGTQSFCTDTIINDVLDSLCDGCWSCGTYSKISTYSIVNMLYFNNEKFGFAGSTVIYSADKNCSDITLHKLYYKTPNLSSLHDTLFLRIVLAHLVPGSGSTASRGSEIAGAINWLNNNSTGFENMIFMGDFNTTSSNETCFQNLINNTNNFTKFYDPPDQPGDWAKNPDDFALYLTQNTRTSDPGDCNPTGGLNNRFDHILLNSAVMNGTDSIQYIPGSYHVVGQDGKHTGKSLIDAPVNTSVPGNVDSALFYMSEHLPVMLHLKVSYPINTGMESYSDQQLNIDYSSIVTNKIEVRLRVDNSMKNQYNNPKIIILNKLGQTISSNTATLNKPNIIDLSGLPAGIYLMEVKTDKGMFVRKFVKQ
jgi:hypothetical protein